MKQPRTAKTKSPVKSKYEEYWFVSVGGTWAYFELGSGGSVDNETLFRANGLSDHRDPNLSLLLP